MRQIRRCSVGMLLLFFLTDQPLSLCAAEKADLKVAPVSETNMTRVTMSVDSVPLKDILKVLSQQSGFNYAASSEVESKPVSFSFDNVPLREALQSIASANNIQVEQKPGSKVVVFYANRAETQGPPVSTQTRIFHLKYSRLSNSPLDIGGEATIGDLTQQAATAGGVGGAGGGGAAGVTGTSSGNLVAARGMDKVIASLLTPDGRITSDVHTNSLIVTDTPEKLDQIEKILKEIDKPSPQVLIEVYLMEVKKNILTDHGVEWGGTNGALGTFTAGARTTGFPFTENLFNKSKGVKATTQGTSTLTLGTLNASAFTATLHMLTNDTHTKILARPRVLTLNNEAANIRLVTNSAIAKISSISSSQSLSTSVTNTAERTQTGIILKMTPQINEDDSVGLFVEPSITTVASSSFFPNDFLDPTTRVVRTMARLKNHQTLVIGGLIDRNDDQVDKKIPVLGDLPFVGRMFNYTHGTNLDRELLIFITPHIVTGYDSFGPENATSFSGQDITAQNVLDEFIAQEMSDTLGPIQKIEKQKLPVISQEKRLIQASAKMALTPTIEKEMTRTLDTLNQKK